MLTAGPHTAEFLLSKAPGNRSFEQVPFAATTVAIEPGTIIGQSTFGAVTIAAAVGNTGDGVIAEVAVDTSEAKVGTYLVEVESAATNAGSVSVTAPTGEVVGIGAVGVEITAGGLTFTVADGDTDYAVGDTFTIVIAEGTGLYKPYDSEAVDGSQVAVGVLYAQLPINTGTQQGVIVESDAEVIDALLIGVDAAARRHLLDRGIKCRV